ncbi:hypothetical protein DPMN_077136 [Dreissena polymorpha]|uniref:Uncharacterized protein n=1 Tax=Dreissena polymorpha TaxID=45954 RepID=A0A9D3YKD3_DREPO|nr:hypothetical protein DPMN_077136 [Dreissena polymorpha]
MASYELAKDLIVHCFVLNHHGELRASGRPHSALFCAQPTRRVTSRRKTSQCIVLCLTNIASYELAEDLIVHCFVLNQHGELRASKRPHSALFCAQPTWRVTS